MPKGLLTLSWRTEPLAFRPRKPPQCSGHLLKEKSKNCFYCAFGSIIALVSFERDLKQNAFQRRSTSKKEEALFFPDHLQYPWDDLIKR